MKLKLYNTPMGLVPCYNEDYTEKQKLKLGEYYEAEIKLVRNVRFHRKFFALLNLSFQYLPERTQNGFRSVEGFRQYVTVAAGYYDTYYSPRLKEFVEIPKSIKFSSMDEGEFGDFYEKCKDVIWTMIGSYVTAEQFEQQLLNF